MSRQNDYENGGIFYGLLLALKINYCLSVTEFGIIQHYLTFKGIKDRKRL